MHSKLYIPANSAAAPFTVAITPEDAGWSESSLHVLDLGSDAAGRSVSLNTGDDEVMILPLAGGGRVECGGESFELSPRASVFDGPADMGPGDVKSECFATKPASQQPKAHPAEFRGDDNTRNAEIRQARRDIGAVGLRGDGDISHMAQRGLLREITGHRVLQHALLARKTEFH